LIKVKWFTNVDSQFGCNHYYGQIIPRTCIRIFILDMIWKPFVQFKHQEITCKGALDFHNFDCFIKTSWIIAWGSLIKELIKSTMWYCPIMLKAMCYVPSFRSIIQLWLILQDWFATIFVNSKKSSNWSEMLDQCTLNI
jgi:hypothetical protein